MAKRKPINEKAADQGDFLGKAKNQREDRTPPTPTGQRGQVFSLIEQNPGILSLTMTADHAIPEAASRVHDLRAMGYDVITTIHQTVFFRGRERHNIAGYSLGSPAWPRPGFLDGGPAAAQIELDLDQDRRVA